MKQINRYWVDENNNRWNIEICTEEQAEKYSQSLVNCYNCHNCRNCQNCRNCSNCDNCCYCGGCRYCDNCNDYKQNPQRYITGKVDSRNAQATFYCGETENNKKEIQVACGCFRGSLEDFEKAVLKTHKDNDLYREQYLKEIEKVKVLFDLEVE